MTQQTGTSRGFLKRLSMYLVGVAIGLVMLGIFQRARQAGAPPAAAPDATGSGEVGPGDAALDAARRGDETN